MLKKTIKYTDYDGNERTEDFYFNLSRAEVTKMEMGVDGGYTEMINRMVSKLDGPSIMNTFERFILDSYGEKSPDGKRFVKNEEIRENFKSTEAYSILFMELCTDSEKAVEFIKAVLPEPTAEERKAAEDSGNIALIGK